MIEGHVFWRGLPLTDFAVEFLWRRHCVHKTQPQRGFPALTAELLVWYLYWMRGGQHRNQGFDTIND